MGDIPKNLRKSYVIDCYGALATEDAVAELRRIAGSDDISINLVSRANLYLAQLDDTQAQAWLSTYFRENRNMTPLSVLTALAFAGDEQAREIHRTQYLDWQQSGISIRWYLNLYTSCDFLGDEVNWWRHWEDLLTS